MNNKLLEGEGAKQKNLSDDYDIKIWLECFECSKEFLGWGGLCPKCEKKADKDVRKMLKKSRKIFL